MSKEWLQIQMARNAEWMEVAAEAFKVSEITHAKGREPFYTVTCGAMAINVPAYEVDGRSAVSALYAARKLLQATQEDTRDPLPHAVYRVGEAPAPGGVRLVDQKEVAAWIAGHLLKEDGNLVAPEDVRRVLELQDDYLVERLQESTEPEVDA